MLKKFFISFLGSLAGICVAGGIIMVAFFAIIASSAAHEIESKKPAKVEKHSVLRINLNGEMVDRHMPMPLMDRLQGMEKGLALDEVLKAIDNAKSDKNIEGIYIDCNGLSAGLAQLDAVLDALRGFKDSGKWIYSYSDGYTQGDYFLASVSDSVFINPMAMVDIHGLVSTTMYFKDFLEKVGVKVQVVKVGTYKSAVEPFILSDMSEANREQQEHYLGCLWKEFSEDIAKNRGVDVQAVNNWADSCLFTAPAEEYVKLGIVDALCYRHEIDEKIAKITGRDDEEPAYVDFEDYASTVKVKENKGANIAVLYALGDINDSGNNGITAEKIVPEIFKLIDEDDMDGLVLRVNSPGGSAYASEQIWEALEQFKERTGKPFYVSMGNVAASGGYYISCGADKIYADPMTITGSIGIFGMIPDAHELLSDKLGINTATVRTNKTEMPDFFNAMSPATAAAMQAYVNRGYETFVGRCAAGRHMPVDSIKAIAEGRVWDGVTAKNIGLVDVLGGLDDCLEDMAAELNKDGKKKGFNVKVYPKVKMEWWEEILDMSNQMQIRAVQKHLGEAMVYYEALQNIKGMSPLQCRMDYVTIK